MSSILTIKQLEDYKKWIDILISTDNFHNELFNAYVNKTYKIIINNRRNEMTDFERYKYILDTTGVKYEECIYKNGMDLDILSASRSEISKSICIAFDNEGKFLHFETGC